MRTSLDSGVLTDHSLQSLHGTILMLWTSLETGVLTDHSLQSLHGTIPMLSGHPWKLVFWRTIVFSRYMAPFLCYEDIPGNWCFDGPLSSVVTWHHSYVMRTFLETVVLTDHSLQSLHGTILMLWGHPWKLVFWRTIVFSLHGTILMLWGHPWKLVFWRTIVFSRYMAPFLCYEDIPGNWCFDGP